MLTPSPHKEQEDEEEEDDENEEENNQQFRHQLLQKYCEQASLTHGGGSMKTSQENNQDIQNKNFHNKLQLNAPLSISQKMDKTEVTLGDRFKESSEKTRKKALNKAFLTSRNIKENDELLLLRDGSEKSRNIEIQNSYIHALKQHQRMRMKTIWKNNTENLWYNDRSQVIYCGVPKVASTNWKRILHTLSGRLKRPNDEPVLGRRPFKVHTGIPKLDALSKTEKDFRMRHYYSFLFTRHPFERVFSAYRDKIQSGKDIYLYRKYNKIILKMIRNEEYDKKTSTPASLTEFIQYIIQIYDLGMAFKMNPHWRPVTLLCSVCKINYTMIGKMETLTTDSRLVTDYIFKQTSLDLTLPTKRRYKTNSSTLLKKALKTVPRRLLEKLYLVYRSDFRAFGYSLDGFI